MKIIVLQDFLRSGGTERQSILLANAFAEAGNATSLLTFRPGGPLQPTVGAKVHRFALQPVDLKWDWFAPALTRKIHRLSPDIVLCMGRMANCFGGRIQRRAPALAVVATMRTGKPLPALFRASLAVARHVIANSREARDTIIQQHGIQPSKVSAIYNSLVFPELRNLDTPESLAARERIRVEQGATATTHVLLCVAMFRREKNQRELIEIVDGLPQDGDWQLWLAGDGPERPACEHLVATKKLEARVKFLGFQANPSQLYRAADLAVHASWSEALSNFLIEAQAHGLTAVAYDAQGIQECFMPNRTGWVISRSDREAFRSTLVHRFSETPATRLAVAEAARIFARGTFDPARQVRAHLDLFDQLVQGSPRPISSAIS